MVLTYAIVLFDLNFLIRVFIIYIEDKVLFPTQIVVTKELDSNAHRWIKALSLQLNKDDLTELLDDREQMIEKADREFANSVLEVSIEANMEIAEKLRGDGNMNAVLMEWIRPEIQAEIRESRIEGAVDALQDLGFEDKEIEAKIIEKYGLTAEEAAKYLQA